MIHSKQVLRYNASLITKSARGFAGLFKKKKPTPKDLEKYDVIIIGCNIGGILSRQFEKATKQHYKVMVTFDRSTNEQVPIRNIYEQGKAAKTDYVLNAKLSLDTNTAHSDGVGVDKILPEEDAVILRNGRRIGYDHLVVATGLEEDLSQIKGFEDAWQDLSHPVFTHREHPSWRANDMKHTRWIYNFTNGNAYFCIPPFPFKGEVTCFNFLTAAQVWKWYGANGKVSPLSKFTVVNANRSFCQYFDEASRFIEGAIRKGGIDIESDLKLVEIDKKNFKATFENVNSGEKTVRDYHNLYAIPPTKPNPILLEAGLVSKESNYLLDVDRESLRHNKYHNIFGLGEVNNIPTTKGFWNSFYQLHVVKHNLYQSLKGKRLNAVFDGRTKVPLQLSQNALTFVEHYYDQKPGSFNLLGKNGGIIAKLRYINWARNQKKGFMDLYLGKSHGPPFYRIKKTFKDLAIGPEAIVREIPRSAAEYTSVSQGQKDVAHP